MTPEKILGERVRVAREARKMSQIELAEAIGSRQRVISYIENGKSEPKVSTLRKLAAALHVSVEWLLVVEPPTNSLFAAYDKRESYEVERKNEPARRRKAA